MDNIDVVEEELFMGSPTTGKTGLDILVIPGVRHQRTEWRAGIAFKPMGIMERAEQACICHCPLCMFYMRYLLIFFQMYYALEDDLHI